jgi:hypothetical protein
VLMLMLIRNRWGPTIHPCQIDRNSDSPVTLGNRTLRPAPIRCPGRTGYRYRIFSSATIGGPVPPPPALPTMSGAGRGLLVRIAGLPRCAEVNSPARCISNPCGNKSFLLSWRVWSR